MNPEELPMSYLGEDGWGWFCPHFSSHSLGTSPTDHRGIVVFQRKERIESLHVNDRINLLEERNLSV
jgi:hypothetical protein